MARSADEIQADIERSRASLAVAVDKLSYRTNPKRVANNARAAIVAKAQSPQGQKVLIGVGVVVLFVIVRRVRR